VQFTHDFSDDLETLDFFSDDPWALVRFADGERAILEDRNVPTADAWWPRWKGSEDFRKALRDSLVDWKKDYFIGIPCPCCDEESRKKVCDILNVAVLERGDWPQLTFSNLFANANYNRFRQRAMEEKFGARCVIVGSGTPCTYDIPSNLVNHPEAMQIIDRLVEQLYHETKTILVAAGPASNVIIHRYWTTCPVEKRRVICDIGSALDPWLHNRFTRGYHDPKHPNRKKVCKWTMNASPTA
jgi:hypothetical protein